MIKTKISIPLFVPSFSRLKADAVWVTIANWAEGLEDRYGDAEVIAGESSYSSEEIRNRCFVLSNSNKKTISPLRKTYIAKLLEILVKDIRWFREDRKVLSVTVDKFKNVPFVWQHHDLFQTQGLRIAKKLGVPSVLFVDAPYVWESKKWGVHRFGWEWFSKRWGDANPCKQADLVLAVSEEVKQAVLALGVDEKKVIVTPCTVSAKRFDNVDGNEVRHSLGLKDDFVIGWVGSFRKFHSLDLLIESFKGVATQLPQAKLLLVGDGPERAAIQEMVKQMGLHDKVIFTGNIPHKDVNSYIKAFDISILPSKSTEGFHYSPLKLREFFAAGVPVIASAVGDVKKVIMESEGGWLVSPGSKDSISEMILKMESNREAVKVASSNARNYSINEMGILKQIDMIESYFAKY
ncbi:glycosyltransferase family 4 protein [Fulvivirga maritima]|uniref:glycosyltransferase family 4 protein n=1 Tax=Fulvivirga maritima TaxID=2904247 RepID=UPI001F32E034|nr:glycosyltransferase family 4 protein [Fulvivirga maritima]UII24841.1 glycosyltransferase family 4 protein [Fulvivirga maritima]